MFSRVSGSLQSRRYCQKKYIFPAVRLKLLPSPASKPRFCKLVLWPLLIGIWERKFNSFTFSISPFEVAVKTVILSTWLACENIRFSSLFTAGDVSRETSPSTKSEEKRMFSQATNWSVFCILE